MQINANKYNLNTKKRHELDLVFIYLLFLFPCFSQLYLIKLSPCRTKSKYL